MAKIRTTPIDHILSPTTSIYEILERQKKLEEIILENRETNANDVNYVNNSYNKPSFATTKPCSCWHDEYNAICQMKQRATHPKPTVFKNGFNSLNLNSDGNFYVNKYPTVTEIVSNETCNLLSNYQKFAYFVYGVIFSILVTILFKILFRGKVRFRFLKRNV